MHQRTGFFLQLLFYEDFTRFLSFSLFFFTGRFRRRSGEAAPLKLEQQIDGGEKQNLWSGDRVWAGDTQEVSIAPRARYESG